MNNLKVDKFKKIGKDVYIVGNNKPGMILCWASWCGHCVRFKPDYIKFTQLL